MPSGGIRLARAAGLLACTAVALLAFRWLAAELVAVHLAHAAGRVEQALQQGQPRWQWLPRKRRDLVAGRVFGNGRVRPAPGGLTITSTGPDPFELGFPVAQRLDLVHWPLLILRSEGRATARVGVVWADGRGRACLTPARPWPTGTPLRIDLRQLDAVDPRGQPCLLPLAATMLRLRVQAAAGTVWTLQQVALASPDRADGPPSTAASLDTPASVPAQLAALDGSVPSPWVWLPANASAEQLLAWRDDAVRRQAGALAVRVDVPPSPPREGAPGGSGWLACVIYLAALIQLARRRRSPGLTLLAAFAGPLWLIAGLQWGERVDWPAVCAFGGALLFAGWNHRWAGTADGWAWIGRWNAAAWWAPWLLLPAAIAVGLAWGHPFEAIKPGRALVYVGWAMLQQWLLLGFALPRLERVMPARRWAVLGVAILFALMHTPNGALMQLCLLAELFWAACFVRSRSLLPVALAHAASALVVGATLIGPVLRSLEVSARFFL
ncbi:MAG: CPBP family intramembrane metalloprotease [Xanthomonadaceae bacterium]|nr:CPBP family intramembrane metalloprotease [Xanthomonadaceae bacterium]MDE1963705.1 CPBP family intramembrane metalloprotease [Xanthomonadaceae bacterium]